MVRGKTLLRFISVLSSKDFGQHNQVVYCSCCRTLTALRPYRPLRGGLTNGEALRNLGWGVWFVIVGAGRCDPPAQVWWCCLLRVDHADRPLQFGYESIVMCVVVGTLPLVRQLARTIGDCYHSRAGYRRTTMEPSVKRFSVSLIRREPRSSEARWREADWNGEAENRSEATLCRPPAPHPASCETFHPDAKTPDAAWHRASWAGGLPIRPYAGGSITPIDPYSFSVSQWETLYAPACSHTSGSSRPLRQ